MPKVLLISHACTHPSYLRDKLEKLVAKDESLHVQVVLPPTWREGGQTIHAQRLSLPRVQVSILPVLFSGKQYAHLYLSLAPVLRRFRPDIIHLDEEPMSAVAFETSLLCRLVTPRSKLVFFTWENLHQNWRLPNVRAIYHLFERFTFRCADAAIAGTQQAQKILRERGFQKPITVIPQFGIDIDLFTRGTGHAARDIGHGFLVGYVGRLIPEKGVDLLIHAARKLAEVQLIIIGNGEAKTSLEKLSKQLGIEDRVRFVGALPREELPAYLSALDALVLPSRSMTHWTEQFGRVLVEAMACQVPVVGSTCGAIPEVIGECGLLFPEDNVEALTACLEKLMTNEKLRRELGEAGRERVKMLFSKEVVAHKTCQLYQSLLG